MQLPTNYDYRPVPSVRSFFHRLGLRQNRLGKLLPEDLALVQNLTAELKGQHRRQAAAQVLNGNRRLARYLEPDLAVDRDRVGNVLFQF
jgi:hypothetical protein